jgi:hypothetical protein
VCHEESAHVTSLKKVSIRKRYAIQTNSETSNGTANQVDKNYQ